MKSWILTALCGLSPLVSSACKSDRLLEPDPGGNTAKSAASATRPSGSAPSAPLAPPAARPTAAGPRVRFVKAPEGADVPALVKSQRAAAADAKRAFLVYVGATWCEPCQRFHEAAQKGELDAELPDLTLLEFDADVDTGRLRPAGFASSYIPLFATATPEGRATGKFIEGGIKGSGAAREIVPRLKKLLSD